MLFADKDNTCVIVPIFNGSEHLVELFQRISIHIPREGIIAVDDGSTDDSIQVCKNEGIRVIALGKNKGKGVALRQGFKTAGELGYRFAFTIDCDLQHDPAVIPRFFRKQKAIMADLLIGKRDFSLGKMPMERILSNTLTSAVLTIVSGQKIYDSQCGYRLYNLDKIRNLRFETNRYQFESEVIIKMSRTLSKIDYVCVPTIYQNETSYISHLRDVKNFITLIIKNF